MTRLLGKLVVLAAAVAVAGYFLNWFAVSTSGDERTTNFQVSFDHEKFREDKDKVASRLWDLSRRVMETAEQTLE